eukprot:4570530-Pleurochrysis_carterae.AAC.1
MALLMHLAVTGGDCDVDRMVAIATTLQQEKTRERGMSLAPTATPAAILPDSVSRCCNVAITLREGWQQFPLPRSCVKWGSWKEQLEG